MSAPAWVMAVSPFEIARQEASDWPDFGPEDFCWVCGRRNPVWNAPPEEWAVAAQVLSAGEGAVICPTCFAEAWEKATGRQVVWRVEVDQRATPLLLEEGRPC